jgi:hypothetical protein
MLVATGESVTRERCCACRTNLPQSTYRLHIRIFAVGLDKRIGDLAGGRVVTEIGKVVPRIPDQRSGTPHALILIAILGADPERIEDGCQLSIPLGLSVVVQILCPPLDKIVFEAHHHLLLYAGSRRCLRSAWGWSSQLLGSPVDRM